MNFDPVEVYLGLGSNLGDRTDNLQEAVKLLSERLRIGKISSVYETEPVGNASQPCYLNQVCQFYTTLLPAALLALLKGLELKLGRTGPSGAPRPIDIDILFYGAQLVTTPELVIPHQRLTERAFVLIPLVEIAPDLAHPVKHKTAKELLAGLKDKQGVVRVNSKPTEGKKNQIPRDNNQTFGF